MLDLIQSLRVFFFENNLFFFFLHAEPDLNGGK